MIPVIRVLLPAIGGKMIFITDLGATVLAGSPSSVTNQIEDILIAAEEDRVTVKALVMEHEFGDEFLEDDVESLGQLPAGARLVGGFYSIPEDYVFEDGDIGSFDLGTIADPSAFTWVFPMSVADTPGVGTMVLRLGKLYSAATDIKLKHKANTVNMTGVKILLTLLYIVE